MDSAWKNREGNRKLGVFIHIALVAVIFVVWYLATRGGVSDVILPSPEAVWNSFLDVVTNGYGTNKDSLFVHLLASGQRLGIAFLLSIITAVPLGLLSGYLPVARHLMDPVVEFYRPIPPLAYYTLLVLWLGISESSKITLLYLAGFAPIYIACSSGVRRINPDYIRASQMLGASKWQTFLHVVFPAALPDIFTGIRTAVGVEYTTLVAAEMVAAKTGIGWMVLDASNWLRSDVVFMGVILMGITGILLNLLILSIEKAVVHWEGKA